MCLTGHRATLIRPSHQGEGSGDNYLLLARIRHGHSWGQADAELATLSTAYFAGQHLPPGQSFTLHLTPVQQGLAETIEKPLLLMWAAVLLVLLIGCAKAGYPLISRRLIKGFL